ncbi:MAG: hypothetical protein ACREBS_09015 [Nitrososphaerales archaeon]
MTNSEKFALYGFEIEIPSDWRVEVNPKSTRVKGDAAFQSQKGNRVFVSWGPLEEATRRFKTLEAHRDSSLDQVKKGSDVKSLDVSDLKEVQVCTHRALMTHVSAQIRSGMMGRNTSRRDIWSIHFYCPNISRYYVMFSMERDAEEFEDMGQVFSSFAKTMVCHPKIEIA